MAVTIDGKRFKNPIARYFIDNLSPEGKENLSIRDAIGLLDRDGNHFFSRRDFELLLKDNPNLKQDPAFNFEAFRSSASFLKSLTFCNASLRELHKPKALTLLGLDGITSYPLINIDNFDHRTSMYMRRIILNHNKAKFEHSIKTQLRIMSYPWNDSSTIQSLNFYLNNLAPKDDIEWVYDYRQLTHNGLNSVKDEIKMHYNNGQLTHNHHEIDPVLLEFIEFNDGLKTSYQTESIGKANLKNPNNNIENFQKGLSHFFINTSFFNPIKI